MTRPACTIEGCGGRQVGRGWCNKHYLRWMKTGDPGEASSRRGAKGTGSLRADGYRVLHIPGHPLADSRGSVLEHRKLLFDWIGDGAHECFHCGSSVSWGTTLVVDHLDFDRQNNTPGNLVATCRSCNGGRHEVGELRLATTPFSFLI